MLTPKRNMFSRTFVITYLLFFYGGTSTSTSGSDSCQKKIQISKKLVQLEEMTSHQNHKIASLTAELRDAKDKIDHLNQTIQSNQESADGTTYIRWGRTTCPRTAFLVYTGYVAGSSYNHIGTAVDPLCLPTDPIYDKYTKGYQGGTIYGAEYQTSDYPAWKYLHDQDIPCAVCRIPRNNVLMIPGKNICHENFSLEYNGYLMSSHHNHQGSSQFVCVDEKPEALKGGHANQDGKLFYFVDGACGSLKCPPYKSELELTCAVCSFSPNAKSTNIKPYN